MPFALNLRTLCAAVLSPGGGYGMFPRMPTIFPIGPYRFFFFAADGTESRHVHVERESKSLQRWLESRSPRI